MNSVDKTEVEELRVVIERANTARAEASPVLVPSDSDTSALDTAGLDTSDLNTSDSGTSGLNTADLGISALDTAYLDPSESDTADSELDAFSPLEFQKANIKEFLLRNDKWIFGTLLVLVFVLFFVTSPKLLSTLGVWTIAWSGLLYSQHLNSKYAIKATKEHLLIQRKHPLGQENLKLDWNKICSINFVKDQNLRLDFALAEKTLSPAQKLVFQDILNCDDGISIFLHAGPTIKEKSFLQSVERFSGQKFEQAFDELENSEKCPATALNTVQYLATGQLQRTLTGLLAKFEKYALFAGILLSSFLLLTNGIFSAIASFLLLLVLCIPIASLLYHEKRVDLSFDDDGIRVLWNTEKSKVLPWLRIQRVRHEQRRDTANSDIDRIEFLIENKKPDSVHINALRLVCPHLFKSRHGDIFLSLNPAFIRDAQSRINLLHALKKYLPSEKIDQSIWDLLNPTDTATYTQLWLDSLGSSINRAVRRNDEALNPGMQLRNGRFEIIESLGSGGQATVYRARRIIEDKEEMVVLKEFVLPSHAGAELSARSLEQIQSEFDLMFKLKHPNIVRYDDIFVEDHRAYLVLEEIEGKSLRSIIETRGALPEDEVIALSVQMCTMLKALHGQPTAIVHRDFTPENLILSRDGTLKVIDFNVAQKHEERSSSVIVGKHSYLPPEQFRGKACPQSDIYALGATMYFLLTGEEAEPLSSSHPNLKAEICSASLDSIVARATELELQDRFSSAEDMASALEELRKI